MSYVNSMLNYMFRNSVRSSGDPERDPDFDREAEEDRMAGYFEDRCEDERMRGRCHED